MGNLPKGGHPPADPLSALDKVRRRPAKKRQFFPAAGRCRRDCRSARTLAPIGGEFGPKPKTKTVAVQLKVLGLESALILGGEKVDPNFALAISNIPQIDLLPQQGANVYDILRRDKLVLTKEAVKHLEGFLK